MSISIVKILLAIFGPIAINIALAFDQAELVKLQAIPNPSPATIAEIAALQGAMAVLTALLATSTTAPVA